METDRYQRVERLFHEALALAPADRDQFIERAADGDEEIARRVRRMIEFSSRDSATAGLLPGDDHSEQAHEADHERLLGRTIGRYRVIERIGEGGFGSVYRAEQQEPVRRDVALKILRSGMDSRRVIARFNAERQTLAMMEHPNIARVFDAGQTDSELGSRPYFVMELVSGEPINAYCDRRRMDARQRLELFITVCSAVQHAHQKGVIHRDLKPSNILVGDEAIEGGDRSLPRPIVIDFGIAKAVHSNSENPAMTQRLEMLGTPQYMSPEQAEPESGGIDTRSDIYSLGVVLYELLTGSTPLDGKTLQTAAPSRIPGLIRERTPEKPSARITRSEEVGSEVARRQGTDVSTLKRRLKGDLDWITLKALEVDRERRYDSAAALAEDVRRHLRDEPVLAGPPEAWYRLGKFVRRNRVAVVAAAVVILALVGGAAGTTFAMLKARAAAAQSLAVNEFMREVLTSAKPEVAGANVKLADVLQNASGKVSERFAGLPEQEARVRGMLADVYFSLSMWSDSAGEYETAAKLWSECEGENSPRALYAELMHVQAISNDSRWRDSEALMKELLPRIGTAMGPDHEMTLNATRLKVFTDVFRGRPHEGEQALRDLRERARTLGTNPRIQHEILNSLVKTLAFRLTNGEMTEAERAEFEALARELKTQCAERYGDVALATIIARLSLCRAVAGRGDFAAVVAELRLLREQIGDRLNQQHNIIVQIHNRLAEALYALGEREQAAESALAAIRAQAPNVDPIARVGMLFQDLPVLEQGGRWVDGEQVALELLRVFESIGGGHPESVICAESFLAAFLSRQGRLDDAQQVFERVLKKSDDPALQPWGVAIIECHYGSHLARRGDFAQAEVHLRKAAQLVGGEDRGIYIVPDDLLGALEEFHALQGHADLAEDYRLRRAKALADERVTLE